MVIDTSVWLDYLYYHNSQAICDYVDDYLAGSGAIEMIPVIYQEVLQGMRKEKDYRGFQQNAQHFDFYHLSDQFEAAHQAAMLYRECRQKGLTIRKPNDCLIAHYCLTFGLELLTIDSDFTHIAKAFPLRIISV